MRWRKAKGLTHRASFFISSIVEAHNSEAYYGCYSFGGRQFRPHVVSAPRQTVAPTFVHRYVIAFRCNATSDTIYCSPLRCNIAPPASESNHGVYLRRPTNAERLPDRFCLPSPFFFWFRSRGRPRLQPITFVDELETSRVTQFRSVLCSPVINHTRYDIAAHRSFHCAIDFRE